VQCKKITQISLHAAFRCIRSFKLVSFESLGAVSYWPSLVWLYLAYIPR